MNNAGGVLVEAWWESTSSTSVPEVLPCHRVDPDAFFAEAPADVEAAKALCRDCPVREACLAGALERRGPWGVWGGGLFLCGGGGGPQRPPRGARGKPPPGALSPAAA